MYTYPWRVASDLSSGLAEPLRSPPARWLPGVMLGGYLLVAAVEVVAVAADARGPQWVAKPLMMPPLVGYLAVVARPAGTRPVVAALGCATAGDVALLFSEPAAFLIGMAFFLGTQAGYLTAFLRRGRPRWAPAIGYALLWAGVNLILGPRLGVLRIPVLIYSLALVAMASAATGVSRRVAAGAALFVLSDLLIGLAVADLWLPAHRPTITVTYLAAQLLIVTGWVAAGRRAR